MQALVNIYKKHGKNFTKKFFAVLNFDAFYWILRIKKSFVCD